MVLLLLLTNLYMMSGMGGRRPESSNVTIHELMTSE